MKFERNSPEGQWLRARWNLILGMTPLSVDYTKWMATGIAAIVAVILANLDSITKQVYPVYFKWGTSLLIISLMTASLACLLSLSLSAGVKARKKAEKLEQQNDTESAVITTDTLNALKQPFWGFLRWVINRSIKKAIDDPFYAEKSSIFMTCIVSLLILGTVAFATIGLILLVVGLNTNA